jgi:hypothetical protein
MAGCHCPLALEHFEESVSPEIAKARSDTAKAMNEVKLGWNRAIKMIEERGALPERKKKVA